MLNRNKVAWVLFAIAAAVLLSSCATAPATAATTTGVLGLGELVLGQMVRSGAMDETAGRIFGAVLQSFQHAIDAYTNLSTDLGNVTHAVAEVKASQYTPIEVMAYGAAGGAGGAATAHGAATVARRAAGGKRTT